MMCSLNIGIDGVNKALLGWDGACVGADTDATNWYNLADGSCKRVKLLNEEATAWNILAQLCDIIREAKAGNLKEIYITFSGHTGQINEELRSNDPDADAKDELWCVYDSYLPDWLLEAFLREIPAGVIVVLIMDTCNAGGLLSPQMLGVKCDVYLIAAVREGKTAFGDDNGGRLSKAIQSKFNGPLSIANLISAYQNVNQVEGQEPVLFSNAICGAQPPQPQKNIKVEAKMNSLAKGLIRLGLLCSLLPASAKAKATIDVLKGMFEIPGAGKARLLLYGENCDGKEFSMFATTTPEAVIAPLTLAIYGCGLAISNGKLVFGRSGGVPPKAE